MSKASAYFTVDGLIGKHDMKELKRELAMLGGVTSVSVSEHEIAVDFDTSGIDCDRINKKISKLGFNVSDESNQNHIM